MVPRPSDSGAARDRLGGALLRVALALRAEPTASIDEIVWRIARHSGVDPSLLLQYAVENAEVLATAKHSTPGGRR